MTARALVAGTVIAVMALSGCVSTVSGSAVRDAKTVPTDVPRLQESALDSVVLPIAETTAQMGTTDHEITSDMDEMTDSSDKVSNQDCLGAMFGAEEPVYEGSGWTAVRDVVAREPDEDNDHWIEQTAVIYPEASNANRFLEKSKSSWQKCVGSSLAVDTSDTSSLWEFGDVTSTDGLIAQVANQEDADGWGCQHALAAASNLTVETWVCAYNLADEATTMAIDIINNASER